MQRTLDFAWLSPEQAAAMLEVTPDHVRDLCRRGKLTARQDRRRWFIEPASVARFLARREGAANGS